MQYSKLLFVLPLASAAIVARQDVVEMDYVTQVETAYVTQYGTAPAAAAPSDAPPAPPAAPPAAPSAAADSGHGHGHFHSYNPAPNYQPPSTWSAPPPPPPVETPAPPPPPSQPSPSPPAAPPSSPGTGSGSCPADTSGKYLSPSVDSQGNPTGGPGKSMIDSMNYIRQLYNSSAACLRWSDSLASASGNCANKGNEVDCCRANSNVISDTQYGQDGYKGPLASSVFEGSMFMMLCQSPGDPELKGTCTGKTGEESYTGVGSQTSQCDSSSSACTGHHDAIIDTDGTNHWMGVASSSASGQSYMSCSFSATKEIFGDS